MVKLRLSNLKSIARVAKVGLVKHAPEILMGTGTVAFVATVVTASRSTIKAQDILADCKEKLDDVCASKRICLAFSRYFTKAFFASFPNGIIRSLSRS